MCDCIRCLRKPTSVNKDRAAHLAKMGDRPCLDRGDKLLRAFYDRLNSRQRMWYERDAARRYHRIRNIDVWRKAALTMRWHK